MTRLVLLVALIGMFVMGLGVGAQDGFSVGGRLSATDQEAQEGYFAIDQQTMIVVKPNSELHTYLRGKVGQRVRVTVQSERESE
jgi:hypothetical protein